MVPVTDTAAPKPDQHFVDAIPEGSVVCISQPANMVNAVWGGLMTARAQVKGALGVIVDGRIRDLNEQREAGFPVSSGSFIFLFVVSGRSKPPWQVYWVYPLILFICCLKNYHVGLC